MAQRSLRLLPAAFTFIGVNCSFLSAICAYSSNWNLEFLLFSFACICDALDGFCAKLLKVDSYFGAEIDSLADAISFGFVPAFIVFVYSLNYCGIFGEISCCLYIDCILFRLARFNVMKSKLLDGLFVGTSSPIAGMLMHLPIIANIGTSGGIASLLVAFYVLLVGLMAASNVNVSLKHDVMSTLNGNNIALFILTMSVLLIIVLGVFGGKALLFSVLCLIYILYFMLRTRQYCINRYSCGMAREK